MVADRRGTGHVSSGYRRAGPGITEDTYLELERLISDAKPCSRHAIGMSINLQTSGPHWVGAASYLGEEITIYPYINETIISGGTAHEGGRSMLLTQ